MCRLLAELVKSYGSCAALIAEHVFEGGMSDLVKEDTTALAFLLDELLVSKTADKEISNLIKTLVAALASCNHSPDAQGKRFKYSSARGLEKKIWFFLSLIHI